MKKNYTVETIDAVPYFNIETFMILSQNRRVDQQTVDLVDEYWDKWKSLINARSIRMGNAGYLLVWLDESVEETVNKLWETSPSQAFTLNSLAQAICMAVMQDLVPEAAADGCAPVPKPNASLKKALREIGVPWEDESTLSRQFAMMTNYPYRGGCNICFLKDDCPKRNIDQIAPVGGTAP